MLSALRPQAPTLRLAFNAHRAFSASSTRRTPEDEIARVMDLAREKAVGKPRPKAGGDTLRMLMFGKPGAGKVSPVLCALRCKPTRRHPFQTRIERAAACLCPRPLRLPDYIFFDGQDAAPTP
jgi:hypothetical protein